MAAKEQTLTWLNRPPHSQPEVKLLPKSDDSSNVNYHVQVSKVPASEQGTPILDTVGYQELDVSFDSELDALWCYMRPIRAPSITPSILYDFLDLHAGITRGSILKAHGCSRPLKYYVQGSRIPDIYNLGGDLAFMIDCIRAKDRGSLLSYAHNCVQVVFNIFTGFSRDVISVGLVEGDALGGGFEAVLCCNYIIAERRSRFGLPEVLFNCFPGMGAYSFLSRRVGPRLTEEIMQNGKIYSADEMHEMGIVSQVVEDGCGKAAVVDFIKSKRPTHAIRNSMCKIRQCVDPITLDELRHITELWVDTTLGLSPSDLKTMQRFVSAQQRRLQSTPH